MRTTIFAVSLICTSVVSKEKPVLEVDFDDGKLGAYSKLQISTHWPGLDWHSTNSSELVNTEDKKHHLALQAKYPKEAVGPKEGGAQFAVALPPSQEMWLSYQVKFVQGFDFRLGGKLPGLTSGGSKFTGGRLPKNGEGWSARYMWKKQGEAVIYLYYMDMPGKWGENIKLSGFKFKPGRWHTLVQHIKVNTIGKMNGLLNVWIDGVPVLSRNNIQYRGQQNALIDTFYFSTFHGGNTAKWGPKNDSIALFDNFKISKHPLIQ